MAHHTSDAVSEFDLVRVTVTSGLIRECESLNSRLEKQRHNIVRILLSLGTAERHSHIMCTNRSALSGSVHELPEKNSVNYGRAAQH
jgi:hypothetical protein